MTHLEQLRQAAMDSSKDPHPRFLVLYDVAQSTVEQSLAERFDPSLPRTVTSKERRAADLVKALGFLRGRYGNRFPAEKWADDCPIFLLAVVAFIDSPFDEWMGDFGAVLPEISVAFTARNNRRDSLYREGLFEEYEAYDWGTPEGNDY